MTCLHALNCHHHGWADYCFNQGAYADLEHAHLEPICWSDMVKFWRMVLEDAYGMGGMKAWSEHTDHELRRYWTQFRAIAVKKDTCSIDNYYVGTVPCCHLQLGLFPTGSTSELFSIISSFGRPYMLESSAVLNPVTS